MKTKWFIPLVCLALVGCDESPTTDKLVVTPKVVASTNQVEKVEQYTVTSKGTFRAGYDNAAREIFILRDNFTGEEYLGVTDCTLIKLIKKKEEAKAEALDAALEIVGAVAEAVAE